MIAGIEVLAASSEGRSLPRSRNKRPLTYSGMTLICRGEDAAAHMMRQSLQISYSGSSRGTEHDHKSPWSTDPDGIDRARRVPRVPGFLVRRLDPGLVKEQHFADLEGNRPGTDPDASDRARRVLGVPWFLVRRLVLGLGDKP